ncbi:hypothetical protein [Clostridium aminobutyricum]|uniref:Uncharacterized protein n=1 Tax=Clostridium aminobutyricum TaxID=33953 RepID=A0A939D9N2_CLOAM|nr:hypothetical protein [Clostridium aminobutyricum]MBN7773660.1 hypothetical protein [Clostridium aminobutyricum]
MSNIVLQLQKNNNDSIINNNDNVIFDETISMIGNVSYNNTTGVITVYEQGLYIIDWYVSMQSTSGSSGVIFKLISDKGTEFDSSSPIKTGNMGGIAVLNVDDAPVNFSLVNASNATVFLPNMMTFKANLRIFYLNEYTIDNSRCFALDQFANLLEQVVTIYPGAAVSMFSNRLATVSGTIDSLYKAPDAGSIPLLILQSGGQPAAFSIDKITMLYFPDSVYDDSITYLNPPDPFPQNCDTDFLKNIYNYVEVGDSISVMAGPTTSASGEISLNEYGIIVLADATSIIFIMTPHIFSLVVDEANGVSGRKSNSISVTE